MHKAVRQTGLLDLIGEGASDLREQAKSRKAPVRNKSGAWAYVHTEDVDGKIMATCIFCSTSFRVGSMTRIVDHLLGRAGLRACVSDSDELAAVVEKLKKEEEAKNDVKDRKRKLARVSSSSAGAVPHGVTTSGGQDVRQGAKPQQAPLMFQRITDELATDKLTRFFYGNNVPVRLVETKTFKEMVAAIRAAPLDWRPPTRKTLAGPSLQKLASALRREEAPLRQSVLSSSGTVLSDGWETVDHYHLV